MCRRRAIAVLLVPVSGLTALFHTAALGRGLAVVLPTDGAQRAAGIAPPVLLGAAIPAVFLAVVLTLGV